MLARGVLQFPNHLLQLQWVSSTLSHLETEARKKGRPLDVEHPRISPILEALLSPLLPIVQTCCSVLLSAAGRGWVDPPTLLSSFASQSASATHYPVILATARQLLVGEVCGEVARRGEYSCPYSLRTNTHPFISILTSRPESGACLISEATQILRSEKHTSSLLKLLEPFVKYVLLFPSPSADLLLLGRHLHSELVATARSSPLEEDRKAIAWLLLKVLPLQPIKSNQQLLGVVAMVMNLVEVVREKEIKGIDITTALLDSCLSLCCEMTQRGLLVLPLLRSTEALLADYGTVCIGVRHLLCVSWLVLASVLAPPTTAQLLSLCERLSSPTHTPPHLPLLLFPLVQLLAQPSVPGTVSHDLTLTNQKAASRLMQLLQHTFEGEEESRSSPSPSLPPSPSQQYSLLSATAQEYEQLLHSQASTSVWLQQITKRLLASKGMPTGSLDHIVLVLSAFSLSYKEGQMFRLLLGAFAAVARAEPSTSPSLLPFLLHLHSTARSPESMLSLLYSIPSLATHRMAIGGVVNTIHILGRSPALVSIATRLMGRVWQLEDNVFPQVQEFLTRSLPPSASRDTVREIELARGVVIRDVCCQRAEQHGEEMLGLISTLMTQSNDPLAVAMVTEGLVALCQAEVVDVVTVWSVLGGRLKAEKRPAVVAVLCQMFELAAELNSERDSHQTFKATALKYLWRAVFSRNKYISSAGLEALSSFQLEDFLVEYLPEEVASQLGLGSHDTSADMSQDPEAPPSLTGSHIVQILQLVPVDSLPAYSTLLAKMLSAELGEIPRGTVYTALRQAQSSSPLERTALSIPDRLRGLCATHCGRDSPLGLITGTMMSVHEVQLQGRSGRSQGRQAVMEAMQQHTAMLEAFLREGRVCMEPSSLTDNWNMLTCFSSVEQWRHFMGRLLQTYCQARLLETCPVSVREDPSNPVLLEKQVQACKWARSLVAEKLTQFARSTPASADNVLLGLVGMVTTPDPIGGSSHVTSSDQSSNSNQWYREALFAELIEVALAVIGGQSPSMDLPNLNTLFQVLQQCAGTQLLPAAVLSLPILVEEALAEWGVITEVTGSKLTVLADTLCSLFISSPKWYIAVSLNQLLVQTIPLCPKVKITLGRLLPYLEAALQTDSLELLSLTSALVPALCVCSSQQPMAQQLLSHLHSTLSSLPPHQLMHTPAQQACLGLASAVSNVFLCGRLSFEEGMRYIGLLADLATKAPTACVYHLSLAVSLHDLTLAGHPSVLSLADSIAAKWVQEVNAEGLAPQQVLPLLWGLAGLVGVSLPSRRPWQHSGVIPQKFLQTLVPLLISILEKFAAHEDNSLGSASIWLMGQVYYSATHILDCIEKVPPSYSYLSESSLLSSLHTLLQTLASQPQGVESRVVESLLQALEGSGQQVPPVDFSSLLIPFCRNKDLWLVCVHSLVHCVGESLGFQQLAVQCCSPVVFSSLQLESQCILSENIVALSGSLPTPLLVSFVQFLYNLAMQSLPEPQLLGALLKGMVRALETKDLPPLVKQLLSVVSSELYGMLSRKEKVLSAVGKGILQDMATCLSHTDRGKELASLPTTTAQTPPSTAHCLSYVMHCCWVMTGKERFTSLQPLLGWTLSHSEGEEASPLTLWLLRAVRHSCSPQHAKNVILHQSDLLHNLVLWTRGNKFLPMQMKLILLLVVSAVTSNEGSISQTGLHIALAGEVASDAYSLEHLYSHLHISTLPTSSLIREKLCQCLTEWLGMADPECHKICLGLLSSLRSSEEYEKALIWTSAAHIM